MTRPPHLINLIADHIRGQRSGNTIVEIVKEHADMFEDVDWRSTILVDGINIGTITEQIITIKTPTYDLTLDARDPNFFYRLDWALADKLDDYNTIRSRRAYREQKELEWRQNLIKSMKKL